ncbi:HET-domain-containing protein [Trematosphaeria pertusa]|uniref:HET-domain-containing protein n=1 Tax=Trematosphaeria pertusa TaxID=390896 RepID=A0A6A6IM57_9PLEO|nr:HET-domain-containing protein [Trematosphaeria pertusa]KAF2251496.1 HET-domain-containing protein [Trematosphaeria pertusa]
MAQLCSSSAHPQPTSTSEIGSQEHQDGSRLCRICRKIDFNRYLGEEIGDSIHLGSWDSIRQSRDCPFCRLVVHSLESDPRLTPSTEVLLQNELSWKLGIELSPYDRSRSESYSNKYDLRSKAKYCSQDAYRFTLFCEEEEFLSRSRSRSRSVAHDILTPQTVPNRRSGARVPSSTIFTHSAAGDAYTPQDGPRKPMGIIQYLAHKEKHAENRQFFGRKISPDEVDIGLLRSWMDRCSTYHNGECDRDVRTVDSLPLNLRLIDVRRRCVIKVAEGEVPEYVALSYMWGSQKMKEETGMDPAMLLQKDIRCGPRGEMTPLQTKLPKTIEDAMTLTRLLGYRYLWNDALCIVQDATLEQKVPDLTNMKLIYSCASLTIAAAAGTHADYGIPGIGVPRRIHQNSEVVRDLRLATMFPSYTALENSSELLWNTRGWTFQEKLLSRRIILFTDYQVYFKCSESIWTEEVVLENGCLSTSVEARRAKYRWQPNRRRHVPDARAMEMKIYNGRLKIEDDWNYLGGFLDYAAAVQEYSKRKLTDPKDTLFAISGILETMEEVTGGFILGLPRKHFLESLLWYPDIGCVQTYNHTLKLPSWTWASSDFSRGGVSFDLMDVRQLRSLLTISMRAFRDDSKNGSPASQYSNPPKWVTRLSTFDWKALSLWGTYGNLVACLSWPLLQKDHTIRRMFYSDGSSMARIHFDLPISALNLPGPHQSRFIPELIQLAERYAKSGNESWRPSVERIPGDSHTLAFETVVVRFYIGKSISPRTHQSDDVGIFELTNSRGENVDDKKVTTFLPYLGVCRSKRQRSIPAGFRDGS